MRINLHKILTSENALALVLGACLSLMGRHVYHVYNAGWWGYVAAFGLGVATMQFILRGHRWRGYCFAGLDMMYNLAFFGLLTPMLRGQLTADQADELLLSVALPVVLAFYAHDYASRKEQDSTSSVTINLPAQQEEPASLQEILGVAPTPLSLNATVEKKPLAPAKAESKPKRSATNGNRAKVFRYLHQHGDTTANAIVKALGVPRGTASVYLSEWRKNRRSMAIGD